MMSPANLTTAIHYILWHLTSKSQKTSTHSKFIGMSHYNLGWLCGVVLWWFLREIEVKQRWARLVLGWVTEGSSQWGILMQPKNRYRMTPGVRHSGIVNWLIIFLFITNTSKFQHITPINVLEKYTGFQSNSELITNAQIHNVHQSINLSISLTCKPSPGRTTLMHIITSHFFYQILVYKTFPFHMSENISANEHSINGPWLWSTYTTTEIHTLPIFRSKLKTHLFEIAIPPKALSHSLDCPPGFLSCYSQTSCPIEWHFRAWCMTCIKHHA